MESFLFWQSLTNGLVMSAVIMLVALGLNLVFGIMGIVNLAHGELYMIGAYATWYLTAVTGIPLFFALLAAAIAVAFLGVVFEVLFFRSIHGLELAGMLLSIGLILTLQTFALIFFGEQPKGVPSPPILKGVLRLGQAILSKERLFAMVMSVGCLVLMHLFISRTRIGKAVQAVAQDQDAASLQGISIRRVSMLVMGIGGALAGISGGLMGMITPVTATMGAEPLMEALVVIVLGGLGSIPGTIVGGFIVGFTKGFFGTYLTTTMGSIAVYCLLFLLLIFKPSGIFGHD